MPVRYSCEATADAAWQGALERHSTDWLVDAYREMLRIRLIEEEIERQYHLDRMKTPIHLVIGQEASAVGACRAMRQDDWVYCGHRTHGVYLAKGGDLKAMLSEMHCRTNGCAGSRGGSMHLIDKSVGMAWSSAIVAGAIPIAVGSALAAKTLGEHRVTTVFFGEAATEEGVASESLNFAALKKLPIVFWCENNFYSVQSPLSVRQPERDLSRWAAAHAMPAERIDGMNVVAAYEAASRAIERARRGEGPTFIEARLYRFRAHGGAGDDSRTGYREEAELAAWSALCPLETLSQRLVTSGTLSARTVESMTAEIKAEIDEAFEHALASPEPGPELLEQHVYSD